jgi:hypothetical protein
VKHWWPAIAGAALLLLLIALLAPQMTREGRIRHHEAGFREAIRNRVNNVPAPWFRRIFAASPAGGHWDNALKQHAGELIRLGHLTNVEFRLTNQVVTPAFASNFNRRARAEIGTNTGAVWIVPDLPGGAGYRSLLPVRDVEKWRRVFDSCVAHAGTNSADGVGAGR